jgi:hypothetical protein
MGGYLGTLQRHHISAGPLTWRETWRATKSRFNPHPDQSCAAITPSLHDTHFDVPLAGPIRRAGALLPYHLAQGWKHDAPPILTAYALTSMVSRFRG